MSRIFIIVLIASTLLLSNSDFNDIDKLSINKIAKLLANQTAKTLPIKIDSITKIIKSKAIDNYIVYTKIIDISKLKVPSNQVQFFNENLKAIQKDSLNDMYNLEIKTTCNNKILKYIIMKKGLVFKINYLDQKHKLLTQHIISKKDCALYLNKNLYKLYNGEYEAVFPSKPIVKISKGGNKFYISKNKEKAITFTSMKLYIPSDIKNIKPIYLQSFLDKVTKNSILSAKYNILDFSSTIGKNGYIATYRAESIKTNHMLYGRSIYKGTYDYRWYVITSNTNSRKYAKRIMNEYKDYCKVLKGENIYAK